VTIKIQNIFPIIIILIFLMVCGCINSQQSPDRNPAISSPTINSSSTPSPTISPSNSSVSASSTTPYPFSDIKEITVFTDKPKYKVGDDITVGITNNLNVPLIFGAGAPFGIQYQTNGTWINISYGGGTQGFWHLQPGDTHSWPWNFMGLYDYDYVNGNNKPFKVVPGVYRVIIGGTIDSKYQETFVMQKEFIIE
jgi:hypothetical protein